MFSDRILPPVSGGNRGRGTVSKTFIVILPKAAKKQTQLGETANLLSVNDHSSTLSHSGFPQVPITVQEYTVPKLKIQESPATFSSLRAAIALRLSTPSHIS